MVCVGLTLVLFDDVLKGFNGVKIVSSQIITLPNEQEAIVHPAAVFFALNQVGTFFDGFFKGRTSRSNRRIQRFHKNREPLGIIVFVIAVDFLHRFVVTQLGVIQSVEAGRYVLVLPLGPALSLGCWPAVQGDDQYDDAQNPAMSFGKTTIKAGSGPRGQGGVQRAGVRVAHEIG